MLRPREAAAGYTHALHQLGLLAEALLCELRRAVAVVALIDAVELAQHGRVAAESRRSGADLFGEPPAQTVACELDLLDLRGTGVSGHGELPFRGPHRVNRDYFTVNGTSNLLFSSITVYNCKERFPCRTRRNE